MARANWKLIDALRETAGRLERPDVRYAWIHPGMCNCGQLAQTINGFDFDQLWKEMLPTAVSLGGSWRTMADSGFCYETGLPINLVFARLLDAGLEPTDFADLENLQNSAICHRAGITDSIMKRDDTVFVSTYLRAWADLLEEELVALPAPPEPNERLKHVKCLAL